MFARNFNGPYACNPGLSTLRFDDPSSSFTLAQHEASELGRSHAQRIGSVFCEPARKSGVAIEFLGSQVWRCQLQRKQTSARPGFLRRRNQLS